ncbi:MAG: tail fiber domain-containing protein [Bacteroidia bacterium]|nr:tail fiber domain-containing protein [Bacteroidia bacterium]
MKRIILLFMSLTTVASAQIKVFSGGAVSYGSTTAPGGGEKHKFTGDLVVSSASSISGSAARIRGNNGYSAANTPDFTWYGNDQTGLFHPAYNVMGFTIDGSEKMRINSAGNLLINTTTDNGNLSIYTIATGIHINASHTGDWYQSMITATNRANSANYLVKLNGTTKFYVAGQGWIFSDGNYLGSDKNIKDEIKGIDSAMSKVNKINGVTYKLKVEKQNPSVYGSAKEYMGVIAQDVEAVAPQVVKTMQDGTKAVCYEMLVGLLIEALKEQNAKVAQLENDVNNCCAKASGNNRLIAPENGSADESNNSSYIKQNNPNPFNKETVIEYFIAERNANSSVLVFDMNGKLLKTLKALSSGKGTITINANDFAPGMYYYSLVVNNKEIETKKMILTE